MTDTRRIGDRHLVEAASANFWQDLDLAMTGIDIASKRQRPLFESLDRSSFEADSSGDQARQRLIGGLLPLANQNFIERDLT